jgi:16S rRNA (cytosine1402-N4)-methyltransferase
MTAGDNHPDHPLDGPHPTDIGELGSASGSGGHFPVMLDGVLDALDVRDGAVIVDATFGGGGYSRAILEAADCTVWGIDRDPTAVERARELEKFYQGRLKVLQGTFSDMEILLGQEGVAEVHGIALDLGVSSFQLDDPTRGFSFRFDGPLDMRMEGDTPSAGPSAADVVNTTDEAALADILFNFGDERKSRRVARAIVTARQDGPITRTLELAKIISDAIGKSGKQPRKIHPATRSFQALRIFVNDELGELDRALMAAERLLAPRGRLAVVSFHSLEDRKVKNFFRQRSGRVAVESRHAPSAARDVSERAPEASLVPLYRRAQRPSSTDVAANPRARSARLRAAERTDAPPWPVEEAA